MCLKLKGEFSLIYAHVLQCVCLKRGLDLCEGIGPQVIVGSLHGTLEGLTTGELEDFSFGVPVRHGLLIVDELLVDLAEESSKH